MSVFIYNMTRLYISRKIATVVFNRQYYMMQILLLNNYIIVMYFLNSFLI